jgi:phosphotriesterase-related protein
VQLDNIQDDPPFRMDRTVEAIRRLVLAGHADRVLLSQDICLVSQFGTMGGAGYDFILTRFLPRLEAAGIGRAVLGQIVSENPARALSGLS